MGFVAGAINPTYVHQVHPLRNPRLRRAPCRNKKLMKPVSPSKVLSIEPGIIPAPGKSSVTNTLLALARNNASCFHDPEDAIAYASIKRVDHEEIVRLNSDRFSDWLKALYFRETGSAAPNSALDNAVSTLQAIANEFGEQHRVHRRSAKLGDRYYIDLCDDARRVVEVDHAGWRIIDQSPVKFVRSSTMRALPHPTTGGKFKPLLDILNVVEEHWIILLVWLIECLRPETNHVGLELIGTHGAAKSTTHRILVNFIDPQNENLLVKPKVREDIFVTAANSHVLSYENLSELSAPIQDALCSMLTGAAFQKRKNYSDTLVSSIKFKRPVILNGINRTVTRPDLLDRFICFELPAIPDGARVDDGQVSQQFESMKSEVFGAILSRFAKALALLPKVKTQKLPLPRMADFALLGEAVAQSLGKPSGYFCNTYRALRDGSISALLAGSPLGSAILSYLGENNGQIFGSYTHVHDQLLHHQTTKGGVTSTLDGWPKRGKAFGNELRRLTPALQQKGISVRVTGPKKDGFYCSIKHDKKV